jgi:hypothetical protein
MADTITDGWDPLVQGKDDPDLLVTAQKREISNILRSYTGYNDLFSELIQNTLDAVEKRMAEHESTYVPRIWININLDQNYVALTDNGCGMTGSQFRQFLRPNFSFKGGTSSRGNKGVGATYLGYGFNHLEVATKLGGEIHSAALANGREWLEDTGGTVSRPMMKPTTPPPEPFSAIDRGTSVILRLTGKYIRPRDFSYYNATTAQQWLPILRAFTPLGGIYLCGDKAPQIQINVDVIHGGQVTTEKISQPEYLWPHTVLGKTEDIRSFLADQAARAAKGLDVSKVPAKFSNLNGLWGVWSSDELLADKSIVKPRLTEAQLKLCKDLGVQLYVFMGFSTELWDQYNDTKLNLRKGFRILRGGLQLATRHMPQGAPITIPLTQNIGYQNITHVVVQYQNAEPDLGRKGFQPEHARLAERLAVSSVTAFKKFYGRLLRKSTGAPALLQEMKLSQWIDEQKEHEKQFPLTIKGKGLFLPTEELPIRSLPIVEQDVVAVFNQMLSSGVIRGIQLLSSSQYNQYDGLFRLRLEPPFDKYIRSADNPLGVDEEIFAGVKDVMESPVSVLEYKYSMDSLIEEFGTTDKKPDDISLAVVWELGETWKTYFDIVSLLDDDNVHHREFHGVTHIFTHSVSAASAFPVIVLKDLVSYLQDPGAESQRQRKLYSNSD